MQSTKKEFVYKAMTIVLTCGLSFLAIPNAFASYDDESDSEIKKRWIKEANQGDAETQYIIGKEYLGDKAHHPWKDEHGLRMFKINVPEGIKWITRSANQGYIDAQIELGDLYRKGEIVRQSGSKAIEWYSKAVNQGDKDVYYWLASMYEEGSLVPVNAVKVIEWSKKGASSGDQLSPKVAAMMYEKGEIVPKDLTEAKEWYGKSCDNGSASGCSHYQELNKQGY